MDRRLKKELNKIIKKFGTNFDNKIRLHCISDFTNVLYNWYFSGKISSETLVNKKNKKENLLYENISYYSRMAFSFISDLKQILDNVDISKYKIKKGYLKETKAL